MEEDSNLMLHLWDTLVVWDPCNRQRGVESRETWQIRLVGEQRSTTSLSAEVYQELIGNPMPSPTQLPVNSPGQFLWSPALGVSRWRLQRIGPLPPPKLADIGAGTQRGGASLTVPLIEQGKEDACFSCFWKLVVSVAKSGASCGQHPAWQMGQWEFRVSLQLSALFSACAPSASTAHLHGTPSTVPCLCSLPKGPFSLLPTPEHPASASSRVSKS